MKELHPFDGTEPDNQQLFKEIRANIIHEGIGEYSDFGDLIDQEVENRSALGFFGDNADLENIKRDLKLRWREIRKAAEDNRPSKLLS